ncbi:ABC transporter ATP-binding protein [Kineosporia rhizophila]|uniref:ABC transporter ATP-binding protein n=1 Tax=Kineosporia TaxID=49184 RepID=UPI001E5CB8D7|nr:MULTISPECIES: ABC transporter ATP-binding protein [Kineosporia]MCE0537905.1 ABC transporter ATP-binding protein [Kineosporia rhizophila]GLY15896.1 multidrug ABC transporter ATP-binding protein [Kineosporia sp. NBRC 101677]
MNSEVSDEFAVRVRGLRRTYGTGASAFEAVRGVDLDVRAGSVTALLGTNGAGKTSTLEVIEGLAAPTAGTVRVLGLDPVADRAAVRRRTGVLLQRSGFSGDLTVRETLRLWAGTLSAPRPVEEMIDRLDLGRRADTKVLSLSGGEARRLDLACTLMGDPELVVLDEPTTGLDPESRREVWALIDGLREAGSTVLVTTHYLDEAETLADRLEIMHAGRIVRSGTPTQIAEGHPSVISFARLAQVPSDLGAVTDLREEHGRTVLHTTDLQTSLAHLLAWAGGRGVRLEGLDARSPSLESVFLAIADGRDPAVHTPELEGSVR